MQGGGGSGARDTELCHMPRCHLDASNASQIRSERDDTLAELALVDEEVGTPSTHRPPPLQSRCLSTQIRLEREAVQTLTQICTEGGKAMAIHSVRRAPRTDVPVAPAISTPVAEFPSPHAEPARRVQAGGGEYQAGVVQIQR